MFHYDIFMRIYIVFWSYLSSGYPLLTNSESPKSLLIFCNKKLLWPELTGALICEHKCVSWMVVCQTMMSYLAKQQQYVCRPYEQLYSTRHLFPPLEQTSNPIRKWLATRLQICHYYPSEHIGLASQYCHVRSTAEKECRWQFSSNSLHDIF